MVINLFSQFVCSRFLYHQVSATSGGSDVLFVGSVLFIKPQMSSEGNEWAPIFPDRLCKKRTGRGRNLGWKWDDMKTFLSWPQLWWEVSRTWKDTSIKQQMSWAQAKMPSLSTLHTPSWIGSSRPSLIAFGQSQTLHLRSRVLGGGGGLSLHCHWTFLVPWICAIQNWQMALSLWQQGLHCLSQVPMAQIKFDIARFCPLSFCSAWTQFNLGVKRENGLWNFLLIPSKNPLILPGAMLQQGNIFLPPNR